MIKILIVDDHALVRMGITSLLEQLPDMKVVAEASNGEDALMLTRSHKPDVVLLDMKMPGIDGFEVARRLTKTNLKVKIIAVTAVTTDCSFPGRLLQLGVSGYITKESDANEMALAIRKVYKGDKYVCTEIAQQMAINSLQTHVNSPFELLTERETQVMQMITRGMTVPEISSTLFLSTKTVNCYRYRMFEKLSIKNDVELTMLAMKHRIIESPNDIIAVD